MTFHLETAPVFVEEVFEASKEKIRAFPGCQHMELLRHVEQPHIFFTLSLWTSPDHLENYRKSELFQQTWAKTKVLFAERAEAWSVEVVDAP